MKAYFVTTNAYNAVLFTDRKKFVIAESEGDYNDGKILGVDLYAENAAEQLKTAFKNTDIDDCFVRNCYNMGDASRHTTGKFNSLADLLEKFETAERVY